MDPLSDAIFSFIMDCVLCSLPKEVEYRINKSCVVNHGAYANDTLLHTSTEVGLEHLVSIFPEEIKNVDFLLIRGNVSL